MKAILFVLAFVVASCGDFNQQRASDPVGVVEDGCVCNECDVFDDGSAICTGCKCPAPACCEDGCDGDDCAMGACDCDDGCECGCQGGDDDTGGTGSDRGDGGDGGCPGGSCRPFSWLDCDSILYSLAPDGSLGERIKCL